MGFLKIFPVVSLLALLGVGCQSSENSYELSPKNIAKDSLLKNSFETSRDRGAMAGIIEYACMPTSSFVCTVEGCNSVEPTTYFFIDADTESGTYFRCDQKGCSQSKVSVGNSGIFKIFSDVNSGAFIKMADDLSDFGIKHQFIDVATLGDVSISSFGNCQKM